MDGASAQQICTGVLLGLLRAPGSSATVALACSAESASVRKQLDDDAEATAVRANTDCDFFRGATSLSGQCVRVLERVGASHSQVQGSYGVNGVVFAAEYTHRSRGSRVCALKALICAHGPFAAGQSAVLDDAVATELRQPPFSSHLVRYWQHFNALVEGGAAAAWPDDVQTATRGSLTKWLVMPLFPDGNLHSYIRLHPVQPEAILLDYLEQLMHAVVALVDNGLLHRDIKLDNILVRSHDSETAPSAAGHQRLHLALADFGCMESMHNQFRGCTPGNPMKVAPELRSLSAIGPELATGIDLSKAEVWALGALFFDFLDVRAPYEQSDSVELPEWADLSELTRALVARLLRWESAERPAALDAAAMLRMVRRLLLPGDAPSAPLAVAAGQARLQVGRHLVYRHPSL